MLRKSCTPHSGVRRPPGQAGAQAADSSQPAALGSRAPLPDKKPEQCGGPSRAAGGGVSCPLAVVFRVKNKFNINT